MARFAFVVPPLVGHVNPTLSVARALVERGHEVAWIGHAEIIGKLLPTGATLHALDSGSDPWYAPALERSRRARGLESLQILWELLVPLARAMRPGVAAAIDALRPDVLVVDQQAIGGALAARHAGIRWATFCTTSATVVNPLAAMPKVAAWVDAQVVALQQEAGLPATPDGELSPGLVVVFSTDALVGPLDRFPAHYRFVGPALARADATPFPFEILAPSPVRRVLVSIGTVSAERGDGFFDTVAEAFAGDDSVQIILVAPDGALAAPPPPNLIVRPRVPQLALLPHLSAVVTHGGHNTVCEALAHGLPLVVTPIRDDQPVIAGQVVAAGCGVRLRYGRLPAKTLRDAVHQVLDDPSFCTAAKQVQTSFAAAGGAARAAVLLEELAA
jgi:MGT family glycosyltransferase